MSLSCADLYCLPDVPAHHPACAHGSRIVTGPLDAVEDWKARALTAEAKVADLTAHIRRLEAELGHAPDGSGAV